MSTQLACPQCRSLLKITHPLAGDGKVRCPKCAHVFQAGEIQGVFSPATPPLTLPASSSTAASSPASRSAKGWLLGLAVGGGVLLLFIVCVLAWFAFSKKESKPEPQLTRDDAAQRTSPSPEPQPPATPPQEEKPAGDAKPPKEDGKPPKEGALPAGGNGLAPDVLRKVKQATVFIKVEDADGRPSSGSGFFAFEPGVVLTNAHVVGMLKENGRPPERIQVILNSGEPKEKAFPGRVIDVDRSSDLAVLRLQGPSNDWPQPLAVSSAQNLLETQQVYIFGFPLGEELGRNITVSTSSVSSLRKNAHGDLWKVQVNGGMHPGNSGGPVVDPSGKVVGVAVAGIPGTQINFAVPGDYVHVILNGRIKEIGYGSPVRRGDMIAVPVTVVTIDPLQRIKKVGVDWWLGNPGRNRPPAHGKPPEVLPGDIPRRTVALTYEGNTAKGELLMPFETKGKVYWVQPMYVCGANQTHWAAAQVFESDIGEPKPSTLLVKHQAGRQRPISLNSLLVLKTRDAQDETHSFLSHIESRLIEVTTEVTKEGHARRQIVVQRLERGISIDGQAPPGSRIQQMMPHLGSVGMEFTVDGEGKVIDKKVDVARVPPPAKKLMQGLGGQIVQSMEVVSIPLPGGTVEPGYSWKAKGALPLLTQEEESETADFEMIYVYRGTRKLEGREVAVIAMSGQLRGEGGVTGQITGTAYYDPAVAEMVLIQTSIDLKMRVRIGGDLLESEGKMNVILNRNPQPLEKK